MTHILIVEDESEIAGYLRRGLAFEGYSAEIAANTRAQLAFLDFSAWASAQVTTRFRPVCLA